VKNVRIRQQEFAVHSAATRCQIDGDPIREAQLMKDASIQEVSGDTTAVHNCIQKRGQGPRVRLRIAARQNVCGPSYKHDQGKTDTSAPVIALPSPGMAAGSCEPTTQPSTTPRALIPANSDDDGDMSEDQKRHLASAKRKADGEPTPVRSNPPRSGRAGCQDTVSPGKGQKDTRATRSRPSDTFPN
jgi:hypothetical protein